MAPAPLTVEELNRMKTGRYHSSEVFRLCDEMLAMRSIQPVEVEVYDPYVMDLVREHGATMTNSEIVQKFLPKKRLSALRALSAEQKPVAWRFESDVGTLVSINREWCEKTHIQAGTGQIEPLYAAPRLVPEGWDESLKICKYFEELAQDENEQVVATWLRTVQAQIKHNQLATAVSAPLVPADVPGMVMVPTSRLQETLELLPLDADTHDLIEWLRKQVAASVPASDKGEGG